MQPSDVKGYVTHDKTDEQIRTPATEVVANAAKGRCPPTTSVTPQQPRPIETGSALGWEAGARRWW